MDLTKEITGFLKPNESKSFRLLAGAGSGKTYTLVESLKSFRQIYGNKLKLHGRRAAVITFTNAACDEIKERLGQDALFEIETIHSFLWSIIKHYTPDIKKIKKENLIKDIEELDRKIDNPRTRNRAQYEQEKEKKKEGLKGIDNIKKFTYSPSGENSTKNALNHQEIITIGSRLFDYPILQKILISKYPILFIDECQDTRKEVLLKFIEIAIMNKNTFSLGLFGDQMQRIYTAGLDNLENAIAVGFEKKEKRENFRSPKRVVQLINKIREADDRLVQTPISKEDGIVRVFIYPKINNLEKEKAETLVRRQMAEITGDNKWTEKNLVKLLTLEHKMASRRLGFSDFFDPLYSSKMSNTLLEVKLKELLFLHEIIGNLYKYHLRSDKYQIMCLIMKNAKNSLKNWGKEADQREILKVLNKKSNDLFKYLSANQDTSVYKLLRFLNKLDLFDLPDYLDIISSLNEKQLVDIYDSTDDDKLKTWIEACEAKYSDIERTWEYLADSSAFGTHQGVKGLEYDRVMAIIDDTEAGGNQFSYEKLFGIKDLSERDLENIREGRDNSIARTRRLFYVICSRSKKHLSLVIYADKADELKEELIKNKWFIDNEIIIN